MALGKFIKSLIFSFILIFSAESALAVNQCESLFLNTKKQYVRQRVIEISSNFVKQSRIQDIEWMKKKLFQEGELEKLQKSDLFKDHNAFLSELLSETVNLLIHDYYKKDSEYKNIPGAGPIFRAIVRDIQTRQAQQNVTHEYFVQINYAIVKLVSAKHLDEGEKFRNEFSKATNVEQAFEILNQIKNEKIILQNHSTYSKEGFIVLPTFAELRMINFRELGIKLIPAGMTLESKVSYDGLKEDSAYGFFFHDYVVHGSIVLIGWRQLDLEDRQRFLKIENFLKNNKVPLTFEESAVTTSYFYRINHEDGVLESTVREFYAARDNQNTGVISKTFPDRTYKLIMDPNLNGEYDIRLTRKEFQEVLDSGIRKLTLEYQKQNNL